MSAELILALITGMTTLILALFKFSLNSLSRTVALQRAELEDTIAHSAEQDTEIEELKTALTSANARIAELEAQNFILQNDKTRLAAESAAQQAEIRRLTEEIDQLTPPSLKRKREGRL